MHKIELQPAYILHSRPYRETSLLIEFFTPLEGRFGAVAKGVRRQKSNARAILQPFVPLLISCVGKGELLTLRQFEAIGKPHTLPGTRLISGFYMNELLMRLLQHYDAHEELFHMYSKTLENLSKEKTSEKTLEDNSEVSLHARNEHIVLRLFEKTLLKTIGYELRLAKVAEENTPVLADAFYLFDPERGPLLTTKGTSSTHHKSNLKIYSGTSLLALANETLDDPIVLRDAKILMREALKCRLGTRPLETRRLF